jgi:hypothetical protein
MGPRYQGEPFAVMTQRCEEPPGRQFLPTYTRRSCHGPMKNLAPMFRLPATLCRPKINRRD